MVGFPFVMLGFQECSRDDFFLYQIQYSKGMNPHNPRSW